MDFHIQGPYHVSTKINCTNNQMCSNNNSYFFSLVEFGSISGVTKDDESSSFYLETLNHHGYHGLINEDETNVVVTPTIKVYITVSIYLLN